MHTSTAKVRRKGAAMQQIRPALTILGGLEEEFSQSGEMSVVFNSVQFSSAEMFGEERFQVRGNRIRTPEILLDVEGFTAKRRNSVTEVRR
jgi:hypothetical protein